ncbi:hypothetical protein ACOV1V_06670 [Leclercia pneumoniae]|uniref:hypothetical protein n=1 Tax=Leclercia pneumoniae TaxID=2815358 RepID=UPI003BF47336
MNLGWEDLENIQYSHWQFKDSDRLLSNFHCFEIFRDDKLNLKIKLVYKPIKRRFSDNDFYIEKQRKEGEVYITDGYLLLENIFNNEVTLEITGITLTNKNIKHNDSEIIATITCSIDNIKKSDKSKYNAGKANYSIDWVTNLDIGGYGWSSGVKETLKKQLLEILIPSIKPFLSLKVKTISLTILIAVISALMTWIFFLVVPIASVLTKNIIPASYFIVKNVIKTLEKK